MYLKRIDVYDFKLHFNPEEFQVLAAGSTLENETLDFYLAKHIEWMFDNLKDKIEEQET